MTVEEPLLDHLVYGAADLEATVARLGAALGVTPVEGGRHVGRGTRNYLLGLGNTSYLEVIGLDAEHPAEPGVVVPFGVDAIFHDRVLTFALHPVDLEAAVAASAALGADHGPVAEMSRLTTTGDLLSWRIASHMPLPYAGLAPFLIDWGASPHPATSGLPRVELTELSLTTPERPQVARLYESLGLGLTVEQGPSGIRALLTGPAGSVWL